jgi:hypothetical protein
MKNGVGRGNYHFTNPGPKAYEYHVDKLLFT